MRAPLEFAPLTPTIPPGNQETIQAFQEGRCTPRDFSRSVALRPTPGVNLCSFFVGLSPAMGPMPTVEAKGTTLNDFAKVLSWAVDRPVIDATGIAGRFDFHLEF